MSAGGISNLLITKNFSSRSSSSK